MFKRTVDRNIARLTCANLAILPRANTLSLTSDPQLPARRHYSKGTEIFLLTK